MISTGRRVEEVHSRKRNHVTRSEERERGKKHLMGLGNSK